MNDSEFKLIEHLIRNISHEIKNPLTTIKGYAQLLAAKPDDLSLQKKSRVSILEQTDRIDLILKNLYDVFSLHADSKISFDAAKIMDEAVTRLTEHGPVKIESVEISRPFDISGDPALFEKMIILILEGFDWENNPRTYARTILRNEASGRQLDIVFTESDFSDMNEAVFFLPYSSKKYYKKGTELYEIYSIAHLHGWKFTLIQSDNLSGFNVQF